jgi:catechol-2,3-dioxygenase
MLKGEVLYVQAQEIMVYYQSEPRHYKMNNMPVHHIAFRTDDTKLLADFYVAVFNLPPAQVQPKGSHWLPLGGGAVLMIEQRQDTEPKIPAGCMEFMALNVTCDEMAAFETRCSQLGVIIENKTQYTRYIRDPDGRRVGVSCYTF